MSAGPPPGSDKRWGAPLDTSWVDVVSEPLTVGSDAVCIFVKLAARCLVKVLFAAGSVGGNEHGREDEAEIAEGHAAQDFGHRLPPLARSLDSGGKHAMTSEPAPKGPPCAPKRCASVCRAFRGDRGAGGRTRRASRRDRHPHHRCRLPSRQRARRVDRGVPRRPTACGTGGRRTLRQRCSGGARRKRRRPPPLRRTRFHEKPRLALASRRRARARPSGSSQSTKAPRRTRRRRRVGQLEGPKAPRGVHTPLRTRPPANSSRGSLGEPLSRI